MVVFLEEDHRNCPVCGSFLRKGKVRLRCPQCGESYRYKKDKEEQRRDYHRRDRDRYAVYLNNTGEYVFTQWG